MLPLVSSEIAVYARGDGAPLFNIEPEGEAAAPPHLRTAGLATAPRMIVLSRQGILRGLAPRVEPLFAALDVLPGTRVGG